MGKDLELFITTYFNISFFMFQKVGFYFENDHSLNFFDFDVFVVVSGFISLDGW